MSGFWEFYPDCPTCGAKTGEQCRTLTAGRVTDTHAARIAR